MPAGRFHHATNVVRFLGANRQEVRPFDVVRHVGKCDAVPRTIALVRPAEQGASATPAHEERAMI